MADFKDYNHSLIQMALSAFTLLFAFTACTPEDKEKLDNVINKQEVVATAIKLSSNELAVEKGKESVITVTFTPANVTNKAVTWVSLDEKIATVNDGIVIGVAVGSTEIIAKCGDATDKCKVTVVISATGIKLNKTSLELDMGDSETLVATVEPEGTTDSVTWETSDEAVATVAEGVVAAVGAGEAIITAKAGTQKVECKVTVSALAVPEAIDLGLTVKWASFNLGASKPEEYGDYYAWGEIKPYYSCLDPLTWKDGKTGYNWPSYKWCNGSITTLIKYNTNSEYGTVDDNTILDLEDDAARANLGGNWRMPTKEEQEELRTKCTWSLTTVNGVDVYMATGPNDNSIYFPFAGELYYHDNGQTLKEGMGSYSLCWSSSLDITSQTGAAAIFIAPNYWRPVDVFRSRISGYSIRPVSE